MLETSQNFMEREVLLLLRRLHAEDGRVTRERLTVMGRGRGLEVARSLMQLKAMGLVEMVEQRPPFWRRLFGARSVELIVPVGEAEAPLPAAPDAVSDMAPAVDAALPLNPEAAPLAPQAEAQVYAPLQDPVSYAPAAETHAAEVVAPLTALTEPVAPPAPVLEAPAFEAPVFEAPAYEAPAAPVAPVAVVQPDVAEAPAPVDIPAPTPAPAQVAPAPRRPTPQGYTDELGGAPADFNLVPRLDPALVEGLRDFLAGMGLELTFAGEALAAQRLKGGAAVGDVVMQLVVFALAHAAHHETLSGAASAPEDLRDYAVAVLEELERLSDAGEIRRDRFVAQRDQILHLADRTVDRGAMIAELLSDPIGGAAPPALLPEELRGVEERLDDLPPDV